MLVSGSKSSSAVSFDSVVAEKDYYVEQLATQSELFSPDVFDEVLVALDDASFLQLNANRSVCVELLQHFPPHLLDVLMSQCSAHDSLASWCSGSDDSVYRLAFFADVLAEANPQRQDAIF